MWEEIPNNLEENVFFETCIKDERGLHTNAILRREGSLWYLRSGTQVTYSPTHYKSIENVES